MLDGSRIVAFAATADAEKARPFYQETLGLTLVADDQFALVFDANGVTLRVSKVREIAPAPYTILGWHVADIRASMAELTERGVVFQIYDGFGQDATGVMTFPGGTMVAWFLDPDGNNLSLTQTVAP